jgi:hypothetical protein
MNIYKKGDWVVTDFNEYPIQLEEDGKTGFFDQIYSCTRFFELSAQDALDIGVKRVYAVRDPRENLGIPSDGWRVSTKVRYANKKDFKLLIQEAKERLDRTRKKMKSYMAVSKSLPIK